MEDLLQTRSDDLARLAGEQAALRRVATLAASGVPAQELLAVVSEEVGELLAVDIAGLTRYEPEGDLSVVAAWSRAGIQVPTPRRWSLGGEDVSTIVAQTKRSARIDRFGEASGDAGVAFPELGMRAAVGVPVIVEGQLWGTMVVASSMEQPLPANTEARLAAFTELVATAIANADGRTALARLAAEQAALRRVATLVARGAPAKEVFAAVTEEVGELLAASVDTMIMGRYDPDGAVTLLSIWGWPAGYPPPGERWTLGGHNVATLVSQTGGPARSDRVAAYSGPIGVAARELGYRSTVATPIAVDGRLWGVMVAGSTHEKPLPRGTEARLAAFTELVAVAIANAESHAALTASRARIIVAADEARRRIERDLHDGAQQSLVSLGLQVRAAQAMAPQPSAIESALSNIADGVGAVQDELRVIARGIHPAILAHGGLRPVLRTVARRSPIPVKLNMPVELQLAERFEVAAYYVVSETLTNAAKHAQASAIHVDVEVVEGSLRVCIRDDGVGGADPSAGSGLVGLKDRVETLGGSITIQSPPGVGTSVLVELPLGD